MATNRMPRIVLVTWALFWEYELFVIYHQLYCYSHEQFLKISTLIGVNAMIWYYAHSPGNAVKIIHFEKAFSPPFYALQITAQL
jgi:hypothetical protein